MKKTTINLSFLAFTGLIMALSIWGPEMLARYRDKAILDGIHAQTVEEAGEGYRYALNRNEKLYILSQSLNSQMLPESEQNAAIRNDASDVDYQKLEGSYAFVVNHRGPSEKEITDEEIYETCNNELTTFMKLGILPDTVRKVEGPDDKSLEEGAGTASYDLVLYSAIDVLEPRNNVAVWKMSLSNSQKNANKENRLIETYIDADDGKIYEFYARTTRTWEDINPDEIIDKWSEYMGLSKPESYETQNPLMEATPFFKKYMFDGMGGEKTIVTVGFYEGINEIFLKISK